MSRNFLHSLYRELRLSQLSTVQTARKNGIPMPDSIAKISLGAVQYGDADVSANEVGKVRNGGGGPSKRGSHHTAGNQKCDQAYIYRHVWRLERKAPNFYLDFGTLVHTGLAYHYVEKMSSLPAWYMRQPNVEIAMQADAKGKPQWLRDAKDLLEAYKRRYASDPWLPLHVEEEFEATVGALDPEGQDDPPFEVTLRDYYGNARTFQQPSLNEEVVTCRPDIIFVEAGIKKVGDHKTGGGGRGNNDSERLPPIEGIWYDYLWQQMYNLHIVRQTYPDVEEFVFNRIKRSTPFDFDRLPGSYPAGRYAKVPAMVRASIRSEREKLRRISEGATPQWYQWECGRCDFRALCDAESDLDFRLQLKSGYHPPQAFGLAGDARAAIQEGVPPQFVFSLEAEEI